VVWGGCCEAGWQRDGNVVLVGPVVGGSFLGERFQRLFALSLHEMCTVVEKWDLWWGDRGGAWLWRRPLRAWEEEQLGEFSNLLSGIVLQPHVADQWLWRHDPCGAYSVHDAI
jgi:hypothetical protein